MYVWYVWLYGTVCFYVKFVFLSDINPWYRGFADFDFCVRSMFVKKSKKKGIEFRKHGIWCTEMIDLMKTLCEILDEVFCDKMFILSNSFEGWW